MTERHCGNCFHDGLGRYICNDCDDDCSQWQRIEDPDVPIWKATARRMAAEARERRREAEIARRRLRHSEAVAELRRKYPTVRELVDYARSVGCFDEEEDLR